MGLRPAVQLTTMRPLPPDRAPRGPPFPPMHEYDLEEIKREIVESRSLTIKTNNLVNALAADLIEAAS
jgi:hypothetical protein